MLNWIKSLFFKNLQICFFCNKPLKVPAGVIQYKHLDGEDKVAFCEECYKEFGIDEDESV